MFSETVLRDLSVNWCTRRAFRRPLRNINLGLGGGGASLRIVTRYFPDGDWIKVNQDRDLVWNSKSYLVWNFLGNDLKDRCYEICSELLCFMKVYTAMREIVRLVKIWGLVKFTVSKNVNFEHEQEASRPKFAAWLDVLLWNKLLVVSAMIHIS